MSGFVCLEFLKNSTATLISASATHSCLVSENSTHVVAGAFGLAVTGFMIYATGKQLRLGLR